MSVVSKIKETAAGAVKALFDVSVPPDEILVTPTKPEFEGDYTIVTFSFARFSKRSPEETARLLGERLLSSSPALFAAFNVIKGFLNLSVADAYWLAFLQEHYTAPGYGTSASNGKKVMVEYSSPNTNKPLHLGHLRNNFLGYSIAEILKANGYEVVKANLVNDRGIHICKSMVAWLEYGNNSTPASTGKKGDHLVGDYYVKFNEVYKEQVAALTAKGMDTETAEKEAPVMKAAQEMLRKWEQNDPEVRQLWAQMNGWVYAGFEETYRRLGVDFDKIYHESETYLLGKDIVNEGLEKGIFSRKADGSVWVDLSADGLDEKLLLRGDGTSVYITQDLGTAQLKYDEYHADRSIYVIGDEQNYHMKVLKLILEKLHKPYAEGIYHLSYGMVELPGGKMKSREGTVVDADDLVDEMIQTAAQHTQELGKVADFKEEELQQLYEILGLGAMKFYLLRVDPKKKMVFNPQESIDFHGFTGPFIQYTYARIRSILRKENIAPDQESFTAERLSAHIQQPLLAPEKAVILQLEQYAQAIDNACEEMDPSIIANYAYSLAKTFNVFYAELSVAKAESETKKHLRLALCIFTAHVIAHAMILLGISVPERM